MPKSEFPDDQLLSDPSYSRLQLLAVTMDYISNGKRDECVVALRHWIAKFEEVQMEVSSSKEIDFTKIEEMKPDLLVDFITKLFTEELRFDTIQPDGTLWCSDSNASIDPHQLAKDLRERFHAL